MLLETNIFPQRAIFYGQSKFKYSQKHQNFPTRNMLFLQGGEHSNESPAPS